MCPLTRASRFGAGFLSHGHIFSILGGQVEIVLETALESLALGCTTRSDMISWFRTVPGVVGFFRVPCLGLGSRETKGTNKGKNHLLIGPIPVLRHPENSCAFFSFSFSPTAES